jgi:DNA repair protein RadD
VHIWYQGHDRALERANLAKVLGLTATPLRVGLGLRFERIVRGATIAHLIEQGYLVRPRYFAPHVEQIESALEQVGILAREFKLNELSLAMRKKAILGDVVGTWQKRAADRQTIAFCVDKQHARELAGEFVAAGITADVILDDTADDDRARIFAAFADCSVRVLCSVGVLGIGFDSPIASCAILARPTLSLSLHVQQGGRVLRPHPSKTDALLLDHAANTLRHGRLEDFVPPDDLSRIDATTDKRSRKYRAEAWICRNCEAVNPLNSDLCLECGTPRRRTTAAIVLDGELREANDVEASTLGAAAMRKFYQMAHCYGVNKAMRNPLGWAYFATLRRFRIPEAKGRGYVRWGWRDLPPMPADDAAARWFRADFQRSRIVDRHRRERVAMNG